MNYFEIFDLPVVYEIDKQVLTDKFILLQKRYHPDHFSVASEAQKLASSQKTECINAAYHTLKDPILRAEYFLQLKINLDLEQEKNLQDMPFLMEQIQWHERLATAQSLEELDELTQVLSKKKNHWLTHCEKAIRTGDYQQATGYVIRLRFVRRLLSLIDKKEEEFY